MRMSTCGRAAALCASLAMALAFCEAQAAVPADAVLSDFPRLTGETDDAPRFRRAIAAAANGILAVGKGEYSIATPIVVTNRCSLEMHPAAHLVAVKAMDFILTWDGNDNYHALSVFGPDGSVYDNAGLFIRGGDIDGNGFASCLRIGNAHHFTLADVVCHNGRKVGLDVSRWNGGHLYELVANNIYCKCTMKGLAGNVGVNVGVCDCHFTDVIVVDYTVGIRATGGANRFTRCHVWGGSVAPRGMSMREWSDYYAESKKLDTAGKWTSEREAELLAKGLPEMLEKSVCFDCPAGGNVFDGCYADTGVIGFNVPNGAILTNCGSFNNPRMGFREMTAIVHNGGRLSVSGCTFNGPTGKEKLYRGCWKDVVWHSSTASGGADMGEAAMRLWRQTPSRK